MLVASVILRNFKMGHVRVTLTRASRPLLCGHRHARKSLLLGLFLAEQARVMGKSFLYIGVYLQAKSHQLGDPLLCRRTLYRANERRPFRTQVCIRRQACHIDSLLDVSDGFLVERGDAPGKRIYEFVQLRVRKRAVDVAVSLGEVAVDFIAAPQCGRVNISCAYHGKRRAYVDPA